MNIDSIFENKILQTGTSFNIRDILSSQSCDAISFVNAYSYQQIVRHSDIILNIDKWYSDGIFLTTLLNYKYGVNLKRISFDFSSIANDVFTYAQKENLHIALIGSTEDNITSCIKNLKKRYHEINITYYRNGFFNENELDTIIDCLNELHVDIVIAGLGTPLQEKTVIALKEKTTSVRALFTCGGFIEQTGIKEDYYFSIVKKYNLMWLQRMLLHKHVRKRMLIDYPRFLLNFVKRLKQ